jgi:hypothetical protein
MRKVEGKEREGRLCKGYERCDDVTYGTKRIIEESFLNII